MNLPKCQWYLEDGTRCGKPATAEITLPQPDGSRPTVALCATHKMQHNKTNAEMRLERKGRRK